MTEAWQDTLKFALTLVSILNPLGVLPVFIELTNDFSHDGLKSVAKSCALTVAITIIIVPLAIPLLAGPGAISTSIIYAKDISGVGHWIGAITSIVLLSIILLFVLSSARRIRDHVGKMGLNIFTRIMGIILLSMSIEMIFNGLKEMGVFGTV